MSDLEAMYSAPMENLVNRVQGESVTLLSPDGTTLATKAIPNELVGAIDERQRKVFTLLKSTTVDPLMKRGTRLRDDSNELWQFMDVRNDDLNTWEVRCDKVLERT